MKKRDLIPPVLDRFLSRYQLFGSNNWSGDYPNWKDALDRSEGYDAVQILEKVRDATTKVKNGEAAFERDSVLFDKVEYNWPLLASFFWAAMQEQGTLNVLDFGGSLGSIYFQNRPMFKAVTKLKWSVVEQDHFVKCGNQFFSSDELKFYLTMEECVKEQKSSLILFSSVLQYLSNPYEIITSAFKLDPKFIVVDSMAFLKEGKDRITIQKVSPKIYKASYPCWMLNRVKFLEYFESRYILEAEFESALSIRLDGNIIPYEGFIFRRK